MPDNHRTLHCVLVTPERAVMADRVDFVALPMYDGELGVLPGRAPLIGRLGPGELRVRQGGITRRAFVDGGFAEVRNDVVTVLTPLALKVEDIDTAAARAVLEGTQAAATTPQAQATRLKAQQRARAQLRIAARQSGETGEARGTH
jgi:F-type H+-transporting ATPase subunit epsilon